MLAAIAAKFDKEDILSLHYSALNCAHSFVFM